MRIEDKLRDIFLWESKERIITRDGKRYIQRVVDKNGFFKGWDLKEVRKIVYKNYSLHKNDKDLVLKKYNKIVRLRKNKQKSTLKSKRKTKNKQKIAEKVIGWLNKTGSRIFTNHYVIPSYIYTIPYKSKVNIGNKRILKELTEFLKDRFPSMQKFILLWIQKIPVRE